MTISSIDIVFFMLGIAILLFVAKLFAEIAKKLGIVAVFGEILAGIVLGPTVLGFFFPFINDVLFPSEGARKMLLDIIANISIVLFLLVAGIEADLNSVKRQGKVVFTVAISSLVVPFVVIFFLATIMPEVFGGPGDLKNTIFALFIATALSISALPVIAKILMDLNYYRSDLGAVIIAAAILIDIIGWLLFAFTLGLIGKNESSYIPLYYVIALTLLFAFFMLTFFRKLMHKTLPYIQAHFTWPDSMITFALSIAFISAAFTQWLGIHALFGAFMAGLAIGDTYHFKEKARTTIEQFVNAFFSPLFFGSIGLYINFITNFNTILFLTYFLIGTILKLIGSFIGSKMGKLSNKEGIAVGFAMNARGAMEIIIALVALRYNVINEEIFVALVTFAIVSSLLSAPIMKKILSIKMPTKFYDFLDSNAFIYTLENIDKFTLIEKISEIIAKHNNLDSEIVKSAVIAREEVMPTGLEHGVAIPHARIEGLKKPIIAVAICPRGINFQAPDGNPSFFVFLILTSSKDNLKQLEIIADISKTFRKTDYISEKNFPVNYTEFLALIKSGSK
jgi:Kef-type K+ transport system membrane component KefB/mannitol/fructose-specific phosphotransferase system IIA component (Ntr-type)